MTLSANQASHVVSCLVVELCDYLVDYDDVIIHVTITMIGITIDMTSVTSSSSKVQSNKFTQEYCWGIQTFSSLPFVSAPTMYELGRMQRQFVQGLAIASLVGTGNNTCKVLS